MATTGKTGWVEGVCWRAGLMASFPFQGKRDCLGHADGAASAHADNPIDFRLRRQREDLIHLDILNMLVDVIEDGHEPVSEGCLDCLDVPGCPDRAAGDEEQPFQAKSLDGLAQAGEGAGFENHLLSVGEIAKCVHHSNIFPEAKAAAILLINKTYIIYFNEYASLQRQ